MPLNAHPPTVRWRRASMRNARRRNRIRWWISRLWGGLVPGNLDQLEDACAIAAWLDSRRSCRTAASTILHASTTATLRAGMKRAAELGLLVAVHAESEALTRELTQENIAAGKTSVRDYLDSRPIASGIGGHSHARSIWRGKPDARLHIVHVSCRQRSGALVGESAGGGRGCDLRNVPALSGPDRRRHGTARRGREMRAAVANRRANNRRFGNSCAAMSARSAPIIRPRRWR